MSKLTREQAASVLEDRVTKIVKAMQVLVKDAPRIADVLDEEARLKTEAFLQMHFADMMRELALAANFRPSRTSFSLDAPLPAAVPGYVASQKIIPTPQPAVAQTVTLPHVVAQPSVPQAAPAVPAERKAWRPPIGRLVGTKEPVYGEPEKPRAAGDEPTELPNQTGYIADAGFIEA